MILIRIVNEPIMLWKKAVNKIGACEY